MNARATGLGAVGVAALLAAALGGLLTSDESASASVDVASGSRLTAQVAPPISIPARVPPRLGERDSRQASAADGSQSAELGSGAAAASASRALPQASVGTLTGRVLDERGAPVSRPELILSQGATRLVLGADALGLDADGRFRVALAPGRWSVLARAREHTDGVAATVEVPAAGEAGLNLRVVRQGILRGRVLLPAEWTPRLPLTFQLVLEVASDEVPSVATMNTESPVVVRRQSLLVGPDGFFELRGCDRGLYRLRLEYPRPGANWVSGWTQTWLDPGDVREGIQLACAEQAAVSLEARVLDEAGAPLEGVKIEAGPHAATSDGNGRFALRGLDFGELRLVASREGYATADQRVEYGGESLSLDVVLAAAPRR